MNNRKFYTCCFTGHRPNKLPWKYNEKGLKYLLFFFKLKKIINRAIKQGYIYFISGMALGADMVFSQIVINLKKKNSNIKLECAIPCANQTEKWTAKDIKKYNNILNLADKITYVSKRRYFKGCMQQRNKYMVDNSNLLLAVYNNGFGGTFQTIQYAKANNLKIKIIKP